MVGIFSKFTNSKTRHRRTQSAIDEREVLPSNSEAGPTEIDVAPVGIAHGIEVAVEFKPVEHPTEPLDNDNPVQCPLPEPSILNDGAIWKERVSAANERRRVDLPLMKEGPSITGDSAGSNSQSAQSSRTILPSLSAPEHNILNLLDECNTSAM